MDAIKEILNECQSGHHCQTSLVKKLQKVYHKVDADAFKSEFIRLIRHAMIVSCRVPAVERSIEFIAKFSTSLSKDESQNEGNKENMDLSAGETDLHPFLLGMFNFLIGSHKANDKTVRFRCCQLMQKMLVELGDEADIDDELFTKIYNAMLTRIKDKFPIVRTYAVLALSRLQDPTDANCPITEAYLFLMSSDPNPDVRRSILSSIAASSRSLVPIINRTRDINMLVRSLAFSVLADKVFIRALTIRQRIQLLKNGLYDRSDMVKKECVKKLLAAWLKSFNGNTIELLEALDIESSAKVCEDMLTELFAKANQDDLINMYDLLDENHCIKVEKLKSENAFYWRCLCSFLKSKDADESLEKILPTCVQYAQYIEKVMSLMKFDDPIELLKNSFILNELFQMLIILDLSDEAGRRAVDKLIQDLLINESTPSSVTPFLVSRFCSLRTNADAVCMSIAEIISEIRQPIAAAPKDVEMEPVVTVVTKQQASLHMSAEEKRKLDIKTASINVQLNELNDTLNEMVANQKFLEAADIKQKILELENLKKNVLTESMANSSDTGNTTADKNLTPGDNFGTLPEEGSRSVFREEETDEYVEIQKNEKTDPLTMLKCLGIVVEMMQDLRIKKLNPSLMSLIESLIIPGIQNMDPAIRNVAVRALGLCCLRDVNKAKDFLILFLQVAKMDTEAVRISAMKILFDILVFFDINLFNMKDRDCVERKDAEDSLDEDGDVEEDSDKEAENESNLDHVVSKVVKCLSSFLNSEYPDIRTTCVEGFARFLLSGRINSSTLLSRLIIQWYNPVTEDDCILRGCLATFFPLFSFAKRSNMEMLSESFVPTLKTILNAPTSSPLSEIKATNLADLLVHLTNIRHLQTKEDYDDDELTPHDAIAIKIANEILTDLEAVDNARIYLKILSMLDISTKNQSNLNDLQNLNQQMKNKIEDKLNLKMLEKFEKQVNAALLKIYNSEATHTLENMALSGSSNATTLSNNLTSDTISDNPTNSNVATRRKSATVEVLKRKKKLMKIQPENLDIDQSESSCASTNENARSEDHISNFDSPARVGTPRAAKDVANDRLKVLKGGRRGSSPNKISDSDLEVTLVNDSQ